MRLPAADALLERDPFSLLVGMLLDQQFPMERAFAGPAVIAERLGVDHLDPADIAAQDPEAFAAMCATPPAVHRYPGSMAGRIQSLAAIVVSEYGGDAAAVWTTASSGADLLARLKALPGFGDAKARIFLALLGQAAGRPPRRLGGSGRRLCGDRVLPVGGRRGRRRQPAEGACLQAGAETLRKDVMTQRVRPPGGHGTD